jgi:hypothetical protein
MPTMRAMQYGAVAVLWSIGCGVLLSGGPAPFATILWGYAPVLLLRRSEAEGPVRRWQLLIIVATLAVFVAWIVLAKRYIPESALEPFIRHPVYVGTVWGLMMVSLTLCWRKERRAAQ